MVAAPHWQSGCNHTRTLTTLLQAFEVSSVRKRLTACCEDIYGLLGLNRLISLLVEGPAIHERPSMIDRPSSQTQRLEPVKVTAAEVKLRMDHGERFAFVDARSVDEWIESASQIAGSVRMAPSEVADRVKAVPQGRTIITYCSCPNEESSTRVASELLRLGFLNVHPLIGGLDAWRAVGGSVERR